MSWLLLFFKKHRFVPLHLSILIISFLSFRFFIERLFTPILGMGWAFLVDQTTPLLITLTTLFLIFKKHDFKTLKKGLITHRRVLVVLFIIAFITHLGILSYFFWSDEVISMLKPITQNEEFAFHRIGGANMRGYFITSYAFLYLVFGVHAWVYPLFSITYFAISALFVYWFIYLLTNKKLVAVLASIFFATTPAYLDMFTWHSTTHAPTLILGLTSFILLLYYKKSGKFAYYVLSLMFFFAAIKMGFVRSAGFALVPLLLLFLPLYGKSKFLKILVYAVPYIAITIYFVLFEFLYLELVTTIDTFQKTGNITEAYNYLLKYRSLAQNDSLLESKLLFHTALLFIPSGLVAEILRFFQSLFPKVSLSLTLGKLSLLAMFAAFLIAIKYRHSKTGYLTIFALAFIFLNMLHSIIGYEAPGTFDPRNPIFADSLDKRFANESIGYGPGSRYLFVPAVGLSLLFALFISWLYAKKGKYSVTAIIFLLIILGSNTYFTIRAQVTNFKGAKQYKTLVESIFKTVPRDGKPKILFSANPRKNGLDSKFSGWTWLYGFYQTQELVYAKEELTFTTDHALITDLVKTGQYKKENLYAFYNNPDTLAFKDISQEAREYYFPQTKPHPAPVFPEFNSPKALTKITQASELVNIAERAVLESKEINKQILGPKTLKFKLKIKKLANPQLPFSDTIIFPPDKQYLFPLKLWELVAFSPWITSKHEVIETAKTKKPAAKELAVVRILQERERLTEGTALAVSNIEVGKNIRQEALLDGIYTTYPRPRPEEDYFQAKKSSVLLTFSFPYTTGIKRILFNTPLNFSSGAPKKVSVFTSLDNQRFQQVKGERLTQDQRSPNRGVLVVTEFATTVNARYLKLEIAGDTQPIVLDEIVVDGEQAASIPAREIDEIAGRAYHFIDSRELFAQLTQLKRYGRLTLLWTCAEESDWQRQSGNSQELVPGIWNLAKFKIPQDTDEIQDSVTINCYGSNLRKIFFISPPYPVEMEIVEAVLE